MTARRVSVVRVEIFPEVAAYPIAYEPASAVWPSRDDYRPETGWAEATLLRLEVELDGQRFTTYKRLVVDDLLSPLDIFLREAAMEVRRLAAQAGGGEEHEG